MYSASDFHAAVAVCADKLRAAGLPITAQVRESVRVFDFALSAAGTLIVLRCVPVAQSSDYRALATMLADGDFDRAALVYCAPEQSFISAEIESWPIGEVDRLAASLAARGRAR